MKFSYRLHKSSSGIILAIADSDIIGKKFVEKDLNFEVSEKFYHENFCGKTDALRLIKNSAMVNAVGKNIISLLVEENIIEKENIIMIGVVPHAQIYTV